MQQLFFRDKGLFLQSLHPAASLTYLAVLLVLALIFTHPLYLLGLFTVIILAIRAVDGFKSWEAYFKTCVVMVLLIMVINPLVMRAGETIIWRGPYVPVFGRLTVSMEAICYGAAMGVRLLDIISLFCLYNLMIQPDKVLQILSRFAFKSALILSLATRMFPAMIRKLDDIREVHTLRGVDFETGGFKDKLQKYGMLIHILLLSSLEDSLEIAEAMQARAFGSGRRSCYRQDVLRPRDILSFGGSILALLLAVYSRVEGYSTFTFYPQLGYLVAGPMTLAFLAAVLGSLSIPLVLSWGWRQCPYLKSKI